MSNFAAIVVAGGAGRRLGGVAKPVLRVAGEPLLHRVLAAVAGAAPRIVVGPAALPLPPGVARTQEQPPGGGPLAATAAGMAALPHTIDLVALLAADLPFLDRAALDALRAAVRSSTVDASVYVDPEGHRQVLCGVWKAQALRSRIAAVGDPYGQPVRILLAGVTVAELASPADRPPPWYDCDTQAELDQAEEWARDDSARHMDRRGTRSSRP